MALIKRLDKGSPITAVEMDTNLQYLEDSISAGTSGTSGSSGTSGTGLSGSSGSSGTSGAGTSGSSGSSGVGTNGSSGSSGTSGVGTSGSSGTSGIGSSGSSGSSGTSGISGAGSTSGTSGSSGTSLALSLFDGDLTRLSGIRNITLSGLSLNLSGSGGATITNLGGGGGGTSLIVASGSTSISGVSTLRVDNTMTLANNGAGTVTIGAIGVAGGGGSSGTAGSGGTSGNSLALTLQKGGLSLSSIENITLSGSIFLINSGSNGAFLRVDASDTAPIIVNGFVSSSQQIVAYDVFPVKNSANIFIGNQIITGSLTSTATLTAIDLFIANAPNFAVPQGNVVIGGSGSRIAFLPTSSLTSTALIDVFGGITPYPSINTVKFSNDFLIQTSGSGVVVVSSVTGSGVSLTSGSGFPFTGSAVITGSLNVIGHITASAFAITSVGVPTIQSATNINLTAGGVVNITSSPLRLTTYTNAQTGSITAQNGDMIYNSTTHKFMGYASGSWVQLH